MEFGKCKLCNLDKELMDSHFVGKAVYRRLNEPSLINPHPIIISSEGPRQSSNQVRDYVFCFDCEQIFNKKGESWVHGQIATTAGFPMLEPLKRYTPIFLEPDMGLFNASLVSEWDCEALLLWSWYFLQSGST